MCLFCFHFRLVNSMIVLLMLFGTVQICCCEELECKFINEKFRLVGRIYSCEITALENPKNNWIITGSTGVHMMNKNDKDVQAIWIHHTNCRSIPTNLGFLFNLTALRISKSQLIEIKSIDFNGMQDLKLIGLPNNNLSIIPTNAFSTLIELRYISLSSNQIEELPKNVFENNPNLEQIYLVENKIKHIESALFDHLNKLNHVNLGYNVCVAKLYDGSMKILELKQDIKANCVHPKQADAAATTKIQIEVDLIKFQEQIKILEKQLFALNEKRYKDQITINELKNEQHQDQLEIAKIKSRNLKLENDLNEIYAELFDGEQCDLERNQEIQFRLKL